MVVVPYVAPIATAGHVLQPGQAFQHPPVDRRRVTGEQHYHHEKPRSSRILGQSLAGRGKLYKSTGRGPVLHICMIDVSLCLSPRHQCNTEGADMLLHQSTWPLLSTKTVVTEGTLGATVQKQGEARDCAVILASVPAPGPVAPAVRLGSSVPGSSPSRYGNVCHGAAAPHTAVPPRYSRCT